MIGKITRPVNPTILIPEWNQFPDLTGSYGNGSSPADYFASFHRYFPSNGFDSEIQIQISDFPADKFASDDFRMYDFKVRKCVRGRSHDWTECPYVHAGEKARRRDPRKYNYSGNPCPDFRKGSCGKGDSCEFAHGVFECWLHPTRYRTHLCKDGSGCTRRVCFFAHKPEELRVTSPKRNGSGSGCLDIVGSPIRHRFELASSPTSILTSFPISSPSESPPESPAGSYHSVSELASSMRGIQLSNMKMGMGFGSTRGSILRPGFFSSPSTPTRIHTMIGPWGSSEEPEMERVESGRELRAKIYARLSKENSVDPGECTGSDPDFGWVFELVK